MKVRLNATYAFYDYFSGSSNLRFSTVSLDKNIFVSYLMPQTPSSNFLFTFNLNTVFKRTRKNIYILYCVLGAGSRVESFFFPKTKHV